MSVTSSTTASRDWEVPPTESFHNRLCLLSITRGDGTPMDASSISEEDIVEICIQKGHPCPLGVLCYLATESIVLFSTADDLNCASCGLVDVTELQDEAIMVQTTAPLEAHLPQCGIQSQQQGMESHNLLPNRLLQVRQHCIISMLSWVTSMTMSCDSLYEISCSRLHSVN